jgi:hypothetical protein
MFIRLEKQAGTCAGKAQWDGICEETGDLDAVETDGYATHNGSHVELGAGSVIYCVEDAKLYVLGSDGSFAEAGT